MDKFFAFGKLIRAVNLGIILLTQLFVYSFLDMATCGQFPLSTAIWLVAGSTVLIAAGGYVINDYFDVKIDALNKPQALVVGRVLKRRWALLFHILFTVGGLALAALVHYRLFIISFAIALLLILYSVRLKYLLVLGNVTIAAMMGLSLLVVVYAHSNVALQWVLPYATFAFLTGAAREIAKDVEDAKGDSAYGAQTLAITYGVVGAKMAVLALLALCALLVVACIGYVAYLDKWVLVLYAAAALLLPLIGTLRATTHADTVKDFKKISADLKLIMLAGVLSMALRCT